jgi:acyl-CoA thioesterase-1
MLKPPRFWFNLTFVAACMLLLGGCNRGNDVVQPTVEKRNPMTTGPIVYVALGDSTGSGVGARNGGYVARLFKRMVERRPGSRLVNLCVSGSTTTDVLRGQLRAEIVVANLPDISSAPRIPGSMRKEYQQQILQFSRRVEEIAARHGVTVFDIYTITTKELASHPEYFSADGFHPSDEGYELWAQEMWPTVAGVIDQR